MGAWEKFQLGWLGCDSSGGKFYDVAFAGQDSEHKLGIAEYNTKQAHRASSCSCPTRTRCRELVGPPSGTCGAKFF